MAGNSKPNIKKLGKEGKIAFKSTNYHDNNNADKVESLLDGKTDKITSCGVLVSVNPKSHFEFTIYNDCRIWAYGQSYSDGGGRTSGNVSLYKQEGSEFKPFLEHIKTQENKWYLLFENLKQGTYKIVSKYEYSQFTEWYVERLNYYNYLLKKNNQYYSFKPSFCSLGIPSSNQELEKWYQEHGVNNLNELVKKKNSKSVDLKLDKNDIYKTTILIDFSEMTGGIEYINEDNKKGIKYNVKEYQLLDLVKKKIGNKFQIGKWEEGGNIG